MPIKFDPITPDMTEEEKRVLVLKALIQFPNFSIVVAKVKCSHALVQQVAAENGIERTYLLEQKYSAIKSKIEGNVSLHRISTEFSLQPKTVTRVADHVHRWKNVDMSKIGKGIADENRGLSSTGAHEFGARSGDVHKPTRLGILELAVAPCKAPTVKKREKHTLASGPS